MAKWGFGEVSAVRGILARLGIFGMPGVRAIMVNSLSGLVQVVLVILAISPAEDRTSESVAWWVDNPNPIGSELGLERPGICVEMGPYQRRSVAVRLEFV